MPENLENHADEVGIICSKSTGEVYCKTGSYHYNLNFAGKENPNIKKLIISSQHYFYLLRKEPLISRWNEAFVLAPEI
jgi:hypothetical protein